MILVWWWLRTDVVRLLRRIQSCHSDPDRGDAALLLRRRAGRWSVRYGLPGTRSWLDRPDPRRAVASMTSATTAWKVSWFCLQRAVRAKRSFALRAIAVDGRAGRSTWINRHNRNLWLGALPRDCGGSSGWSAPISSVCCLALRDPLGVFPATAAHS